LEFGKVGEAPMVPRQKLVDVPGAITAGTARKIRRGNVEPVPCNAENDGALFFNKATKKTLICDGDNYVPIEGPPAEITNEPDFDSGFIPIAANYAPNFNCYLVQHNLGYIPRRIMIRISENDDGSGWSFMAGDSLGYSREIAFTL